MCLDGAPLESIRYQGCFGREYEQEEDAQQSAVVRCPYARHRAESRQNTSALHDAGHTSPEPFQREPRFWRSSDEQRSGRGWSGREKECLLAGSTRHRRSSLARQTANESDRHGCQQHGRDDHYCDAHHFSPRAVEREEPVPVLLPFLLLQDFSSRFVTSVEERHVAGRLLLRLAATATKTGKADFRPLPPTTKRSSFSLLPPWFRHDCRPPTGHSSLAATRTRQIRSRHLSAQLDDVPHRLQCLGGSNVRR